MLLFPHDLMLMMRANVAKLRTTVQVDPVATMFGGDDDLAIAMLRICPKLTRGVVHAPNLPSLLGRVPAPRAVMLALCDPHAGFKSAVHHLHAVVHLLSVVASEAEWEARSEAARLNRLGLGRPFP